MLLKHLVNNPVFEDRSLEARVRRLIKSAESLDDVDDPDMRFPHAARYKSFEINTDTKTVEWVTQESDEEESQQAADVLARILKRDLLKGWTVKVIRRDYWPVRDESMWKTAVS